MKMRRADESGKIDRRKKRGKFVLTLENVFMFGLCSYRFSFYFSEFFRLLEYFRLCCVYHGGYIFVCMIEWYMQYEPGTRIHFLLLSCTLLLVLGRRFFLFRMNVILWCDQHNVRLKTVGFNSKPKHTQISTTLFVLCAVLLFSVVAIVVVASERI